jgi:hypothetical protein
MQNNDPDSNDSGNNSNPKSEADEPIESEQPYIAPDGREHILEVGDDTSNTKSPQSENTK